jgi:hypothetical protein
MQRDRSNAPALVRDAGRLCPDCDHRLPPDAFYLRGNGSLSTYCKVHQRQRSKASYRRRRQDPAALARMRVVDRTRKRAARARLKTLDPGREARQARSRTAAARRLIAAHLEEYRRLLDAERAEQHIGVSAEEGGAPDAA